VGDGTAIHGPRSGWDLRNGILPAGPRHGNGGDSDLRAIALAEQARLRYPEHMSPPVLNLDDVLQRIVKYEREIRALGVSRLALFGSVLRGTPHEGSDVDMLVQFVPGMKSYDRFLALSELLERCLGRRVDLVTTEALSPYIGPRILEQAEDVLRAA